MKIKLIHPLYLLCFILLHYSNSFSQNSRNLNDISINKHNIKLHLIGQSDYYINSLRIGYEYRFNTKNSIEIEEGYTFYSREDKTATDGIYSSLSYRQCLNETPRSRFSFGFTPFYHLMYMNSYLLYSCSDAGIGNYFEFKKTKYKKERYGFNLLGSFDFQLNKHLFLELNGGIGVIRLKTTDPEDVVQTYYRNGLLNQKDYTTPALILNLKVGYSF